MRPLERPPLSRDLAESVPAIDVLIQAFGAYCCFSEEPLFDVAAVWNRTREEASAPSRPPGERWADELLISPTTLAAAQRSRTTIDSAMLFPDVDRTFDLTSSPFTYALEPVSFTLLDDGGRPSAETEVREFAIVRGATPRAQATIDAFALNGRYFSAVDRTMRIPLSAYLSREDNRPFLRTRTWVDAERTAELVSQLDESQRRIFLDGVRMLAVASGFWSVWATVLWNRFHDRAMLAQVLLPRANMTAPGSAENSSEETSFDLQGFPGTRPGLAGPT